MAISKEGERPYTREIHEARLTRIQQIVKFGLEFARGHDLTEDQKLIGELPDSSRIEVSDYPIRFGRKIYLRFFIIDAEHQRMSIQYDKNKLTGKITIHDSTKWNKDGTPDYGHIQTAYSQAISDPGFQIDIEGMIRSVSSWRFEPRRQTTS